MTQALNVALGAIPTAQWLGVCTLFLRRPCWDWTVDCVEHGAKKECTLLGRDGTVSGTKIQGLTVDVTEIQGLLLLCD